MAKNKIIYHVFIENPEMEGMFGENKNIIDYWYCNDANWRGEYFNGMMKTLGIDVIDPKGKLFKELAGKLSNIAREDGYGQEEDE